ncbi:MAG: hypothetical protein JWQ25_375 [Daejeonella sp.]|nr:hypothetical protein [Daejeonella sp.]
MSLPTLIAGPILRRVEPASVSVWLAFSKAQFVQLVLWDTVVEGSQSAIINTDGFYAKSEVIPTVEFASNLHVLVLSIDTSLKKIKEDTAYCYNIYFGDKNTELSNDLATCGFLNPAVADANQLIKPVALGYDVGRLPTLVVPGITLETFHSLHGSCRKIHGEGDEALRHADTLLGKTFEDLTKRPQQLVLTGDQIYADEIPKIVLPFINALGKELFGKREQLAFVNSSTSIDKIPADMTHFPANCRQQLINQWAKFTGNGIASHLTSFQEYCSTYLHYWSQDVWSKELVLMLSKYRESKYDEQVGSFHYYYLVNILKDLDADLKDLDGGGATTIKTIFEVLFKFTDESLKTQKITEVNQLLTTLKTATLPAPTDAQKEVIEKWKNNFNNDTSNPFPAFDSIVKTMCIAESLDETLKNQLASFYSMSSVLEESRSSCDFLECVPLVRRVLANIPTYMIFDDHEITDDWNFSQFWKNRAYTSPIGTQILRNGLMAYTIFQDWGNVPTEYPAILFNPPANPDDDLKKKQEEYLNAVGKVKGNKIGLLKKISEYGKAISKGEFPEAPAELSYSLDTLLLLGEKKEEKDGEEKDKD